MVVATLSIPSLQGRTPPDPSHSKHHVVIPDFDPNTASGCAAEAAAYAAALVDLQSATQAADNAYNAWQQCLSSGGGYRTPASEHSLTAEHSILVRDNR
ncbi:MAG: hypothetical protein MI861_07260 [Pirellulales bacterium]|nr:hypothetical protein [Pirellulales bacterium]